MSGFAFFVPPLDALGQHTDSATVYLDLVPSAVETFQGVDAATVLVDLVASGIEFQGVVYTEAATIYLDLQPSGTEYLQPLIPWWDPLPEGANKWVSLEGNKWAQTHQTRFSLNVRGRL